MGKTTRDPLDEDDPKSKSQKPRRESDSVLMRQTQAGLALPPAPLSAERGTHTARAAASPPSPPPGAPRLPELPLPRFSNGLSCVADKNVTVFEAALHNSRKEDYPVLIHSVESVERHLLLKFNGWTSQQIQEAYEKRVEEGRDDERKQLPNFFRCKACTERGLENCRLDLWSVRNNLIVACTLCKETCSAMPLEVAIKKMVDAGTKKGGV